MCILCRYAVCVLSNVVVSFVSTLYSLCAYYLCGCVFFLRSYYILFFYCYILLPYQHAFHTRLFSTLFVFLLNTRVSRMLSSPCLPPVGAYRLPGLAWTRTCLNSCHPLYAVCGLPYHSTVLSIYRYTRTYQVTTKKIDTVLYNRLSKK